MSKTILVYAENRDGKLRQVALETLGAARLIAGDGDSIRILVAGSNITEAVSALNAYGADTIYTVEHDDLENYNPEAYMAAIEAVIGQAAGCRTLRTYSYRPRFSTARRRFPECRTNFRRNRDRDGRWRSGVHSSALCG